MSDWAQVTIVAIPAVATIICEVIRTFYGPKDKFKVVGNHATPNIPVAEVKRLAERKHARAKRSTEWERARNLSLILFVAVAAIEVGLAFLPRPWTGRVSQVAEIRIVVTQIPPAGTGGPETVERIAGKVSGVAPADFRIVIYAQANHWYVQPFSTSPITNIRTDGTWDNDTHLGSRYAVLLVKPSFVPANEAETLPSVGGDVVSMTTVSAEQK